MKTSGNNKTMTDMKRADYQPPMILRELALVPDAVLLAESENKKTAVRTMGHEVENFSLDDSGADHTFASPDWNDFNWQ